jgi:acetyl-CoA C-acetyltransferase
MDAIVLAGACRTAIGKFGGALSGVPAAKLGETVVWEALRRANVPPESVDQVLMGCVLTAAQGQNPARQAAVGAGIPVEVPAVTIGNVCGSGLTAVNMAAALIRAGDADIVVAGAHGKHVLAPYALPGARFGYA